jgi:hypothetical protein
MTIDGVATCIGYIPAKNEYQVVCGAEAGGMYKVTRIGSKSRQPGGHSSRGVQSTVDGVESTMGAKEVCGESEGTSGKLGAISVNLHEMIALGFRL